MLGYMISELNNVFYGREVLSFPLDVLEIEGGYLVVGELPGVDKNDIKIDFEDGILTIAAARKKEANAKYLINERNFINMKRSINFGDINEESISAKVENGLLKIVVKTKEPEQKAKKTISIE